MQDRVVGQRAVGLHPHPIVIETAAGLAQLPARIVGEPHVDRMQGVDERRDLVLETRELLTHRRQFLRVRHLRDPDSVFEAGQIVLERDEHRAQFLTVLHRGDLPIGEGLAVAETLHVVLDRLVHIAAPDEMRV